ncbi:hypothetical protein PV783_24550 [Chitinophaga sp. CC14]|uniref:hypothetical protein n=1 Tax=Chitinophaga sp. CC14 TaxID=3029199 RepID=UPI003B7AE547
MIDDIYLSTHDAVIYLLTREGRGMTAGELAEMIEKEDLSIDVRRNYPTATDINRRISGSTYRDAFQKEGDLIYHIPVAEKRLLRLTYNNKMWQSPIRHKWSEKNRDKNVAFENQWGFGFEEWLTHPSFSQDGYQYGAIRGADDIKNLFQSIREVYLFTLNQETGERFLVGMIRNLELIATFSPLRSISRAILVRNLPVMKEHLGTTGADSKGLERLQYPSVRFRLEDLVLYEDMIPADELHTNQFKRFIPYKIDGPLNDFLKKHRPLDKFEFKEGRGKRGGASKRTSSEKETTVNDLHVRIVDALECLLSKADSPLKGKIGVEKCGFGPHIADIVVQHDGDSYSIIEVKTSRNIRWNIRDALGQLIDYAFWYPGLNVQKLVIVSPERIGRREHQYFSRVKAVLTFELEYWWYNEVENRINFVEKKL